MIAREVRKQRILDATKRVYADKSFDTQRAKILAPMPDYEGYVWHRDKIRADAQKQSVELRACWQEPLLSRDQELHIARQYNYWKHQARNIVHRDRYAEAERRLAKAVECRQLLALANIRLAVNAVKKMNIYTDHREDVLSEAYAAVMHATDYFDWRKGLKFCTYATWVVKKNLWRILGNLQKPGQHETGEPDLTLFNSRDVSHIQDNHQTQYAGMVNRLLCLLPERDRIVIKMRFGIGCEKLTLDEVGRELGVTKERIRQLEVRALRDLKEFAEETHVQLDDVA